LVLQNNSLNEDLNYILKATKGLWEELREKNIFITGGTGFFGCWFLESFVWINEKLDLKAETTVLTRNQNSFKKKVPHLFFNPNIHFFNGDVRDFPFPKEKFSHIIHAAAPVNPALNINNSDLVKSIIVDGMKHVLSFSRKCGAKKMLFISSGAVYGEQPAEISHLSEDYLQAVSSIRRHSVYGDAKLQAENLCQAFSKNIFCEIKIARCFSFVGPYLPLNKHFAIGNFIADGLKKRDIQVKGDGTAYRSYLYAADLVIWLWYILIRGNNGQPYNVGSDKEITIANLADMVSEVFDSRSCVKITKQPKVGNNSERYIPSVEKVKRELGLSQTIFLKEAIQKTKQWYESRN